MAKNLAVLPANEASASSAPTQIPALTLVPDSYTTAVSELEALEREVVLFERESDLKARERKARQHAYPTLASKLAYVQEHVPVVRKTSENEDDGWKFAPISAFYGALGPHWNRMNLVVTFPTEASKSEDVRAADGRIGRRTALDIVCEIRDGDATDDAAPFQVKARGEALDYGGKDGAQAQTAAIRNALIAAFRMHSGEEPDKTSVPQGMTLARREPSNDPHAEERKKLQARLMQLSDAASVSVEDVKLMVAHEAAAWNAMTPNGAVDIKNITTANAPIAVLTWTADRLASLADINKLARSLQMPTTELVANLRATAQDETATKVTIPREALTNVAKILVAMGGTLDEIPAGTPEANASNAGREVVAGGQQKYGDARHLA